MKVITTKAAYLQKYYFDILLKSTLVTKVGVPLSICDVVNKRKFDKYDSKDFIKFTKREEIEFLKNATWIPNFYDYIKKSSNEIEEEIVSLDNEGNKLNKWFQSLSKEERQLKYEYSSTKGKMLMYKKESLNDILAFISNKESRKRFDDRLDNVIYSKPLAFCKKLTRRIKGI